jgi:hypothetical protein
MTVDPDSIIYFAADGVARSYAANRTAIYFKPAGTAERDGYIAGMEL